MSISYELEIIYDRKGVSVIKYNGWYTVTAGYYKCRHDRKASALKEARALAKTM